MLWPSRLSLRARGENPQARLWQASRQTQVSSTTIMAAPMTTEMRASWSPAGPDPKTIGTGPMNTTPPTETVPLA